MQRNTLYIYIWNREHTCVNIFRSGAVAVMAAGDAGTVATAVGGAVASVTDTGPLSGDSHEPLSLLFIGLTAAAAAGGCLATIDAVFILATAAAIRLADGTSLIVEF